MKKKNRICTGGSGGFIIEILGQWNYISLVIAQSNLL